MIDALRKTTHESQDHKCSVLLTDAIANSPDAVQEQNDYRTKPITKFFQNFHKISLVHVGLCRHLKISQAYHTSRFHIFTPFHS